MEDSTAEETKPKNLPPTVITVDTGSKKDDEEGSHGDRPSTNPETETRTPKHANKSLNSATAAAGERGIQKAAPNPPESRDHAGDGRANATSAQAFFAPRPFEGHMGGPNGAFQPHERLAQQHNQLMSMQVSPGAGRYYPAAGPGGYPVYDQHGHRGHEYGQPPPPPPPNAQYGQPMYPPQQYPSGYSQRHGPPGWGHQMSYHNRPPPPNYPNQHPGMMQGYQGPATNNSNFSRAVSSSFDRSINSRKSDDKTAMEHSHPLMAPPPPANDDRSVSEDGSWRQLNQIQSVDEEEMRKRLAKRETPSDSHDVDMKRPSSNSSSLTNSPTEGLLSGTKKGSLPDPPKMTNSLDSLSSVASAQEPLATAHAGEPPTNEDKPLSPADSAAPSLDLMKCNSESSNLLLPAHQRNLSQFSFEATGQKRGIEEVREDTEVAGTEGNELRKTASEDGPPAKRGRLSTDDKKASPLSIECSPTNKATTAEDVKSYPPTSKDSFYDKPPMYSYSIESAPAMPSGGDNRGDPVYPSFPVRSHSSASSTIPPVHQGDAGQDRHPGVTQIPSWEIQGQDSFGGGSTANPLVGAFSFTQDYPMLSHNNSMLSHPMEGVVQQKHHGMPGPPGHERNHSLESRNQSFEGGHYHGGFSRAEGMSFESRSKGIPDARQGYQQPHYPPHAQSWGSAGSYAQPPQNYPPHYRMQMHPSMMRTFSQESGHGIPQTFQPPSEFQAPPTNLNKNRSRTEKHIMTTPFVASKSGVFGWTKEEDRRLGEILKKHKNPRDWEPIAKELGCNRTAKECHERWIRYLKPGVRKGQWTDQEDAIVMEAVTNSKEQPFTRWSDLAQRLPGRVGKQIRDRWVNHLNPNINHLPFSRADDLLLWDGHQKLGKRWVEIATSSFKSTRSENHIKNRWYSASFKKFIANEFGPSAYSGSKPGRPVKKDGKKKSKSPSRGSGDMSPTTSVNGAVEV